MCSRMHFSGAWRLVGIIQRVRTLQEQDFVCMDTLYTLINLRQRCHYLKYYSNDYLPQEQSLLIDVRPLFGQE
jgi:hypothetical protein